MESLKRRSTPRQPVIAQHSVSEAVYSWSPSPSANTLSLPEQIAERVGNAIIRGAYEPGARLQEQEIANEFNVSRGPVREALRILERDGLLQINPRRGAQVTSLTIAEVKDLFEVRIALAGLAGRLAAEKHGTDLGVRLKKEVEDLSALAKSGDADSYTNAIYRLYMVLADGGGNSFLRNTLFALAHRTLRYARLGFASAERRIQSARNWKLLAAAVTDLDAGAAQKAAERLVRDSRDSAVKLLQRQQLKDSK